MTTHESYKLFLQKIVDTHYPDESLIFDIEADSWIAAAENGEEIHHASETSEKLGAGGFEAVVPIVSIVSLVIGSFRSYYEITKLKKELKIADEFVKEMISYAK
jgi:hypothetical protein